MKKLKVWTFILLICTVITSVLLLCSCNDNLVEKNEEIVEFHTWFFTSGVRNNAITVKLTDANAEFDLRVDGGAFVVEYAQKFLQSAVVGNGDTVYWQLTSDEPIQTAYVDVIAKVDGNIVGYAVIKISQDGDSLNFTAEVLKSVVFPKVNNQFQNVSQRQVEKRIEAEK